jgi:hypothetical protein
MLQESSPFAFLWSTPRKMSPSHKIIVLVLLALWAVHKTVGLHVSKPPYTEEQRIAEYHKRGYKWPLADDQYHPNTDGWRGLMQRRFDQIIANEDPQQRWDGWLQTMAAALIVP